MSTAQDNMLVEVDQRKIALLDIDGCLLNIDNRLQFLLDGDYDKFLAHWETDRPIPQGVYFYRQMVNDPNIRAVFNTARGEHNREITEKQLRMIFGKDAEFELWMCPDDMHDAQVGDVELKLHALARNGVTGSDIFIAFDDRNCIVEAYRRMGICSYQTDTGY